MNAIILAAGMGTRLRPLTNDRPKCLVEVLGEPLIERQIRFLHEAEIKEIVLVSGYKAERLEFLKEKYGVIIVENSQYDTCNNIYSLFVSQQYFSDTYILEGDVYLKENCFLTAPQQSTYFAPFRENFTREWELRVDEKKQLIDIVPGNGSGYIMSGVSYWTAADAALIKRELAAILLQEDYTNLFWDEIPLRQHKAMNICVQPYQSLYEIDTERELRALEQLLLQK